MSTTNPMAGNSELSNSQHGKTLPSLEIVDFDGHSEPPDSGSEQDDSEDQWESESLLEDAIEGLGDHSAPVSTHGPDICTPQESVALRALFQSVGEDRFLEQTLEAGHYTAKKLCTAFGIIPPPFLEGAPDQAYEQLLELAISRYTQQRQKLKDYNTIDDAVSLLKSSKNVMVVTGAGISTSLGIPDFRSKDTGLYSQLEHLGLDDPQQVFDIELFREDPSIFYSIAKDIFPASTKFSPTHAFVRLIQDKDKLLTNFTQNIDNLESHAGISSEKLIQCHGSFATATCQICKTQVNGDKILAELKSGTVARCRSCLGRLDRLGNPGVKRKRSTNDVRSGLKSKRREWEDDSDSQDDYEVQEAGVMKPDITFFGEALSSTFRERLLNHDQTKVDLVIVIGTSLRVAPVANVPSIVPPHVPQIYISRDPCKHVNFDIQLLGDCDVVVAEVCKRAGWSLQHEMVKEDLKVDVLPIENREAHWLVRNTEPVEVIPTVQVENPLPQPAPPKQA